MLIARGGGVGGRCEGARRRKSYSAIRIDISEKSPTEAKEGRDGELCALNHAAHFDRVLPNIGSIRTAR